MKMLFAVLLLFSVNVQAITVSVFSAGSDVNAFDISAFMDFPAATPIFGLIGAGGDPNSDTIIPLNFNLLSGAVIPVASSPINVDMNLPSLGGGYVLSTGVGFGLIPTKFFEPVFFDGGDWHTADKVEPTSTDSLAFFFNPDPVFDIVTPTLQLAGTQGGLLMADVQVAAVPIPAAAWLFGSGLIGMIGVARRKK